MLSGHRSNARGFTLLELLLSVVLFFAVMVAAFKIIQTYSERELARATARYVINVADAVEQILGDSENFNALYEAAVDNGGGYELLADNSAAAPAADNIAKVFPIRYMDGPTLRTVYIQGSRLFQANFTPLSPLRTEIRVLLQVATQAGRKSLDVMVITRSPRPDGLVLMAASAAGAGGGFIRSYSSKAAARVRNSYASWFINPSAGLSGTSWYTNDLPATLNSATDGSFLVYYRYANANTIAGDYLFRIPDPDPALERNRMHTAFNIGGNNIIGADNVNIGTGTSFTAADLAASGDPAAECVGGVLCVAGAAILKGSASIRDTMEVTGSALVADSARAARTTMANALTSAERGQYGAENAFVVDGNGNDGLGTRDQINIDRNATFRNGSTVVAGEVTGLIQGRDVTMADGRYETGTIEGTRRVAARTVTARSLQADHSVRAGLMNNGSVTVENGRTLVVDNIRNTRDLVYGTPSTPRRLDVGVIDITGAGVPNSGMTTDTFTDCQQGCDGN